MDAIDPSLPYEPRLVHHAEPRTYRESLPPVAGAGGTTSRASPTFTLYGKGVLLVGEESPLVRAIRRALESVGARIARRSSDILDPYGAGAFARSRPDEVVAASVRQLGHLDLLVVVLTPGDFPGLPRVPPTAPRLRDRLLLLDVVAAAEFAEQGRAGRIVHVVPAPDVGSPASEAGAPEERDVLELTRGLAVDLGRHDITVNAVAYGPLEDPENVEAAPATSVDLLRIPKGRLGRADDVGATTVFLCAEESDYLTGAVLHLDGGHRLT